jgi:hypothetical protein
MSNRERCIDVIDKFPDERLTYVVGFLENAYKLIEEDADDNHCVSMYRNAKNDPENAEGMSIEQFAAELGVNLNENEITVYYAGNRGDVYK